MGRVGGVLKGVVFVILEEITGWCGRPYRGWRILSQTLSSQEINIVQSKKKNLGFTSYALRTYLIYLFSCLFI